jgi:aldehyde dehydrogenase (NAD+)
MTTLIQGHVINGKIVQPVSDQYIDVINPVSGEIVGQTARGTAEDIDKAVQAAKTAFPAWRDTPAKRRATLIAAITKLVSDNAEELVLLEASCTGIGAARLAQVDFMGIGGFVQTYAEGLEDYPFIQYAPIRPLPEPHDIQVVKEPLGVCGLIIPWNGPLYSTFIKTMPAIAAGNTVVIKPSETASLAVVRLVELLQSIFPAGVINVVTGYGHESGAALVEHPDVAKISFTGSGQTGRLIQKSAADTFKRVTLELGGKGAGIVLPDADIEATARGATFAFLVHSGQICVSGTRLFVHESIHDELVARMAELASGLKAGSPFDPETVLAPMAFAGHYERVLSYIESGKNSGATLACGGEPLTMEEFPNALFVQPTIFTDVTPDMQICAEEIFGPVLCVIKYSDVDDAIRMANDTPYGLSAGIWTGNPIDAQPLARRLEAGTVWINDWHAVTNDMSFGGVKQSGYGREGNLGAIENFVEAKNYVTSFERNPHAKMLYPLVHRS